MACGGGALAGPDSPHAARIKHKQVLNKETFFSGAATVFCVYFLFLLFFSCRWFMACFRKPSNADQPPPPITSRHVTNPANRCDILLFLSSSSSSL